MKVISVNGITKSGKTTICETIIKGLKERGYTVGSVKEIHFEQFKIDTNESGNTNRHRRAGSQLVTARGLNETDILYQEMLPIEKILSHYDQDYLILEGVTDCNVPCIIAAHTEQEVKERIDCRAIAISGVIANSGVKEVEGLPVFNVLEDTDKIVDLVIENALTPLPSFDPECCSECGYSCREFTGRVINGLSKRTDCVLCSQDVELLVNGNPIKMVPFVQKILKNEVLGITSELQGYMASGEITVKIKL